MNTNLFTDLPTQLSDELFEVLLQTPRLRIERIISRQHSTPEGKWYDQDWGEWVVLLQGSAALRIDGQEELIELKPGDYINLPAHLRHRVEWTDPHKDTIWLAIHYEE